LFLRKGGAILGVIWELFPIYLSPGMGSGEIKLGP
jgi:hypothetical protein